MIMVTVEPIFHIIAIMINTMSRTVGTMILQGIINATKAMIIPLATATPANITTTMTVITIASFVETIINGFPVNQDHR